MSLEHQRVFVQNDDPSITYVGKWTTVQANVVNNFGNFGPAFSPTLQSASTTSSLSFPFHGSSISVFGTINIANATKNPNPTWQCVLDGINLGSPNIFQFPENNWLLFSQGNIPDGAHELVVNVTSKGMPFYFDYIEYRPSANVSRENSLIWIDNVNSTINYISGWGALGTTANQTTDPKGLVNVTFVGTQLSWYGFIPTEEPHNASSGEYSIDDEPFAPFQLPGLTSASEPTVYNQRFFTTSTVIMGTHTLSVKYTGRPGQTPLTLDYLIVTNGSFPSTPSSNPGGDTNGTHISHASHVSTSSPTSTGGGKARNTVTLKVGAIVGGIVGAVVGLAITTAVIYLWFRVNRRRRHAYGNPQRETLLVSPFEINQHTSRTVHVPTSKRPQVGSQAQDSSLRPSATDAELTRLFDPSPTETTPNAYQNSPLVTLAASDSVPSLSSQPTAGSSGPASDTVVTEPRARFQHEDSGIRIAPVTQQVLENPPIYSQ